eukprot:m.14292 g.14292  ORF g.14292 m.14292 type:complete len:572 (-) comp7095_c0_seq2:229-1944(-)
MPNSPTASHSFQYPAAAAVPDQPPKQQPQPQQPQQPQQLSPQQQQQLLQHRQLQEQLQRLNPLQYSAISQAASAMLYRQMQPPVPAVTTSAVPMMPAYFNPYWQQQQYHLMQQPQPHIVAQPQQQHAQQPPQEPVTTVPTAWLMEILFKKEQQTRELDQLKEQLAAAKSAAAAGAAAGAPPIVHSAPASPPSVTTGGSSPKRSRKPMAEPLAVPAASSSTSATPAAAAAAMQPPTPTVLAAGAALKAIRSSQPPAPAPRTSPVPVPAAEEEARKSPVGGKRSCEEADAGAEADAEAAMECDKKDGLPAVTVDDAPKQKRGSNDSLATDDTHNCSSGGSSNGDAEEAAANATSTDLPQYAGKPERMAREVDRRLSSREAERMLREYVEQLTKKLMAMKERPFRLSLCQRPDDRFLHEIELPVLYRLPAFLEYQGKEFPRQLLVSDMLFEDAAGRAVLDLKRLRGRVIVRIEKSGQRKRSRMYAYRPPPTVQPFDLEEDAVAAEEQPVVEGLQEKATVVEEEKAVEEEEKAVEEKAVEAVDVSTAEDVDDLSRSLERQSSLSDSSSQKSDTQR